MNLTFFLRFFRSLSYSLLHRNDLLWNSSLLSRSGHRSISGLWRHDSCGPIVSSTERRWHSYDVSRIFLRHLLLRHYSLDNLLHDCYFHRDSGIALGYLWYVFLDYQWCRVFNVILTKKWRFLTELQLFALQMAGGIPSIVTGHLITWQKTMQLSLTTPKYYLMGKTRPQRL